MKLVFFGTADFALPSLRVLANSVCLVVSQPDRPTGRGMSVRPSPVRRLALELGLPTSAPQSCREPEFVAQIAEIQPDALLVAAYGQIMPLRLFDTARHGGINLHGSVLPKYRGAAPIQRAILEGESETGVTLMQMDKGMDSGDIIAIERTPIGADETYSELQDRLAELAAQMAATWMPRIASGDYSRTPQRHEEATHAPRVEKAEAELRWDGQAAQEYNRYRAFTERPGATIATTFGNLRIRRARCRQETGIPGTVLSVAPELTVAFREGSMAWIEVQAEGRKPVTGRELANGWRLRAGDRLEAQ